MSELHELLADPYLRRLGQLFLLIAMRLLPVITLTPLFGGPGTPAQFRVGFSLLLAGLFTPVLLPGFPETIEGLRFLPLLAKEAFLGVSIALVVKMLFEMVAATGAFMDLSRGATMAQVLNPTSRQQSSILNVFLTLFFVTLFLTVGGHHLFFLALGESFLEYPPGALLPAGLEAEELIGTQAALRFGTLTMELFVAAAQLAAPVIAVLFVIDVAMGLINKVAPRIQVFFLSMTIKGTLGILILFIVFSFLADSFLEIASRLLSDWGGIL